MSRYSSLVTNGFCAYDAGMISILRFIGVANAALWFGATLFLTFFAGPAFFSQPMLEALQHRYYAGLAAQVVLERYFLLHYLCVSIALAHLIGEWLYLGRRIPRFMLGLWAVLLALILFGGLYVQPRLQELHQEMYYGQTTTDQTAAAHTFRTWHGISQVANLVVMLGVTIFLWRTASAKSIAPRHAEYRKFLG